MSDDPASEPSSGGTAEADRSEVAEEPAVAGPSAQTSAAPTPADGDQQSKAEPIFPPSGAIDADQVKADAAPMVPSAPPDSATAPPSETSRYRPSYVFLVVLTLVNLVADLWSKGWAKTTFESAHPHGLRKVVVIEDYLNLIYAKNRGGAWGLLQNETESLRRPFFLIVSVAAIVFIVSLYRKLAPDQRALRWGLPLVLGGALGNLVDRIRYGFVVDFIDVYAKLDGQLRHWPTFNVADISICVGVGLMAIDMFTPRPKEGKTDTPKPAGEAEPLGIALPPTSDPAVGGASVVDKAEPTAEPKDEAEPTDMPVSSPPVEGT